jgi:hypothetical protein
MLKVSARTGEGMEAWIAWLEERRAPMVEQRKTLGDVTGVGPSPLRSWGHTHGRGPGRGPGR